MQTKVSLSTNHIESATRQIFLHKKRPQKENSTTEFPAHVTKTSYIPVSQKTSSLTRLPFCYSCYLKTSVTCITDQPFTSLYNQSWQFRRAPERTAKILTYPIAVGT